MLREEQPKDRGSMRGNWPGLIRRGKEKPGHVTTPHGLELSPHQQPHLLDGGNPHAMWPWVKTNGTILGVFGAPPILEPILVGIGMFTGGEPGF